MLDQEASRDKGGILAFVFLNAIFSLTKRILSDDMGLGKTVQMLATMAKNQPDSEDEDKTALVVVPAALMQQWKEELETKTNGITTVHVHHGKDKLRVFYSTSLLQKVSLTRYLLETL
jgi:SNF2 family DNA or RNA helicase